MSRAFARSVVLGVALACLASRADAQEAKARTVGKDGLKIQGTVAGTDNRVEVVDGDKRLRLAAKLYPVQLQGGKKYRLEMVSGDLDSFLVVQDAGGKQLAADDDSGGNLNAKLAFTPPGDATYKVYAASLRLVGKFTLTIQQEGQAAAPKGAEKVKTAAVATAKQEPGETGTEPKGKIHTVGQGGLKIESSIEGADKRVEVAVGEKRGRLAAKRFLVKMQAGAKYQILMSSDAFDSFLVVQDAGGKQLAFDDDSGGGSKGLDAKLEFTAPEAGTYKIYAAALVGTGKFTLTVRQQGGGKDAGEARPVGKEGLTINGKLSNTDKRVPVAGAPGVTLPSKVYLVKLKAGVKYRLEMKSQTLDSFLIVQDQDGKQLAFDDDTGGGAKGLDAKLDFTPTKSGTYKVFAASNAKETMPGEYTLTIRPQGGAGAGERDEVREEGTARREADPVRAARRETLQQE